MSTRHSLAGSASDEPQPTPSCSESDEPTPKQIEGPYFKTQSPERFSLIDADISGTKLHLQGRVLSTDCEPIAGALLDFWQADDKGRYDLAGYRLRGHQFSDDHGRFRLETVVPGRYPYRTPHIHVKVQAPHQRVLTTQLYFPAEPQNERDFLFDPRLLMVTADTDFGMSGRFDFVLSIG
jgi:protocatechuate 3,4-dioxygenase beta subunit